MRRRVTFSRNLTLSLSRTCRCYCKYCAFATHRPHLHDPDEVERILDGPRRHRAQELLVLTGEAPDHHPGVRARLAELGFEDFTAYVVWRSEERGVGRVCRYRRDWSSDVCSSDLAATASTARSPRTARTCTIRTRWSGSSTAPGGTGRRSCWCSPARRPTITRGCVPGSRSSGSRTSRPTWCGDRKSEV